MMVTILLFTYRIFGFNLSQDQLNVAIGLLAILAAVVIGIPGYKSWKKEKKKEKVKSESLFKTSSWIKTNQLEYTLLDFTRLMQDEQTPSYQKDALDSIHKILNERKRDDNQNHILLVGPSLSGKTHMTIKVLQGLSNAQVLIPNELTFENAAKEGYELPEAPENTQHKIVLLENLHEFFKSGAVTPRALIHLAINKGYIVWANCISIDEYERVKNFLDFKDGGFGPFQEIELRGKLELSEANSIRIRIGMEKLPNAFNGLMGEIYYPPYDMIQHYDDIKSSDIIAWDVLLFIKQAYMLGAFTFPYLVKLELLKKAYTKKYSTTDYIPLMTALKKIKTKGFINILPDHTFISFDSVWLNEIVEPQMRPKDFTSFWFDVAPIFQYNYLITSSKTYEEACIYYDQMTQSDILLNKYVHTSLLSKSPDYQTALKWYEKIGEKEATNITYSALICKSPDYQTAVKWYKKIKEGSATLGALNFMITQSLDYDTAHSYYLLIPEGRTDTAPINALINLSSDYQTAEYWYGKIYEGKATAYTYNTLISKSPNYETAFMWYGRIKVGEATVITYNSMIWKSPNYNIAYNLWYKKIGEGQATNATYNILIGKSPDYKTALEWYAKIEKGKATGATYHFLIAKAPDYEHAVGWYSLMEADDATLGTYYYLIYKSEDLNEGLKWLEVIKRRKLMPDEIIYGALINNASRSTNNDGRYQIAISLHDEMLEDGIRSNVKMFTFLISLSPTFQQAFEVLKLMITHKDKDDNVIFPNERTKTAIQKKAHGNPKFLEEIEHWFSDNASTND